MENKKEEVIRLLPFPDNVRHRASMYLGGLDNATVPLREICDNSCDIIAESGKGDTILISNNFNGFLFVADNSLGIPISMSIDRPEMTQAALSILSLHSGSKFEAGNTTRVGLNGVGSAAVNACSEIYVLLSKITDKNYNTSTKEVYDCWINAGPREKKNLYYIIVCEKGKDVYEGAGKLGDLEKKIFKGIKNYISIPKDMNTIVLFKPDPTIFESTHADIPIKNLQYYLLIQEKFYGRKINVIVDGGKISSQIKPYKFEILRTIIPKDNSVNKQVGVYLTFEVDPSLGPKIESGSVNGLDTNRGQHIQIAEGVLKAALKEHYKIKHECLLNGMQFCMIVLANECQFNSQTKENLKAITKVKMADFAPIVKDIIKIFKKDPEYWDIVVEKLNQLAESMKSIGAIDKAARMMDSLSGVAQYRAKADYPKGFADATGKDRVNNELFLCFSGDTEILTCNDEKIKFTDLVSRLQSGEELYTFSRTSEGKVIPAKIIEAKQIKTSKNLVRVSLDNGEFFTCTEDHEIMLRDGNYKTAGNLEIGESLMPVYISTVKDDSGYDRRVVRSAKLKGIRSFKKVSNTESEYFIYRIMAQHRDVKIHKSMDPSKSITRHHLDENTLNDNPNNLMLCSSSWHYAHHRSLALHKKAKSDSDFYQRVYVKSKQTKEFRERRSKDMRNFYNTPAGDKMRQHLREKAQEEWKDSALRNWRSKETTKYANEHPDWVKENSIKSLESLYTNFLLPKVQDFLGRKPESSRDWNWAIMNLYYSKVIKKPKYYDALVSKIDSVKEMKKVIDDNPDYLFTEHILNTLVSNGLDITLNNFNDTVKNFLGNPQKIEQGRGYLAKKRKFPELFKKFEIENNYNHKVVKVEFLNEEQEVYCLEVDTKEHNFPLACGIFVKNCEGLSAGGSLIMGRPDTRTHAILPLRGKILNVTNKEVDRALESKVIGDIFNIIGLGLDINWVGNEATSFEEEHSIIMKRTRYGKIVICTDSDNDGDAIFNEILYLFAKFSKFLIEHGMVYRALGPIFKGYSKKTKKETYYYPDDPIDPSTQFPIDLDTKKHYSRYKGLASLSPESGEVYDAFFNPKTRRLIQITPDGLDYAKKLNEDINERKNLLFNQGILSNPYNFNDL